MVNIRPKLFILGLIAFILLLSTVYAQSKLVITDVDVKVGSRTSNNLEDGDTIDDEAEPGDVIEVRVEVKNNFTSSEDLEIEDITVETTIEEIDDGDDLTEEASDFDLRAGRDKRVTLKFEVPESVEEDSFDILIEVDGDDENGTGHSASMTLRLDVDKENHLLRITRASLSPQQVMCGRRNVQLSLNVINIGAEDEDEVNIQIQNSDLGLDIREDVGELTEDPEDDENEYSNTFNFNVPSTAEEGDYPIRVRALYDNDRRKAEETVTLTIQECQLNQNNNQNSNQNNNNQNTNPPSMGQNNQATGGVVVVTPPTGTTTEPSTEESDEGVVVTTEGPASSNAIIIGIIIAEIVAVIVGIVLLFAIFRRKDEE